MTTKGNERACSPGADALLGKTFPVLNDGFVRLVDYLGNDASVVQAARVSYGKGTKKFSEDRGLIRYMLRGGHTSPFEQCEMKVHIRIPMDAWRQMIRHRTASVNEYSTRYSEAIDARMTTEPDNWRAQATNNKQGSSGLVEDWPSDNPGYHLANLPRHLSVSPTVLPGGASIPGTPTPGQYLTAREADLHAHATEIYEERLRFGVAREVARKDLPLSTYTEAYWKMDLHNLLHYLSLRMDAHAQMEIRSYANIIGEKIVAQWVPTVWEAFCDYRLNAIRLSAIEIEVLAAIHGDGPDPSAILEQRGLLGFTKHGVIKLNRELDELKAKFGRMGIEPFWPKTRPSCCPSWSSRRRP